ncbi:hypothetical protein CEXT_16681 [Caerostris extrusa]|uniref:Uncharacterized protein n=1 Tax=Caerostris extrusa TaxID=172846 RepID=A0AAV4Q713_CAEEX|nr:hypothetical protein CEXT_16681 [Caerostris extrusa]
MTELQGFPFCVFQSHRQAFIICYIPPFCVRWPRLPACHWSAESVTCHCDYWAKSCEAAIVLHTYSTGTKSKDLARVSTTWRQSRDIELCGVRLCLVIKYYQICHDVQRKQLQNASTYH